MESEPVESSRWQAYFTRTGGHVAAAPKPDKYDVLEAYVADLQAALNVSYWKITVALLPETVTALLQLAFVPSVVSSLPPLLV